MCAVCAQRALVRPIQPFYLTKWGAPYKGYSQSAAWGGIFSVERWETLDRTLDIDRGGMFLKLTEQHRPRLVLRWGALFMCLRDNRRRLLRQLELVGWQSASGRG
jgi:hypothetical protein